MTDCHSIAREGIVGRAGTSVPADGSADERDQRGGRRGGVYQCSPGCVEVIDAACRVTIPHTSS